MCFFDTLRLSQTCFFSLMHATQFWQGLQTEFPLHPLASVLLVLVGEQCFRRVAGQGHTVLAATCATFFNNRLWQAQVRQQDRRACECNRAHTRTHTHTHTHPYTYTRIHIGKRLFPLGTFFSFDRLLSSLPWCLPFRIIVVTSAMSSHPHPRHLPTFVTFPSLMFSLLSSLPCSVHFRTFFISLVF